MAVLKCKSCGGPLEPNADDKIVECSFCGLKQTIPSVDDEFILQMFNQANELRRQFDFDGAKAFLQAVVSRYPEDAEAYWHICLCKYGIMYVEDQLTGEQIPTFYRMVPQSILADPDYLKARQLAGITGWKYEEEAQKIEKLQKKIMELTNNEDPYDIFLCYKKTDIDSGMQTEDSRIAGQIYMKLIENGYRVFWAERSLPAGCEYEPYIYAALSTAKMMLVLSSDKRYFEATWVKNEWIRYLDMMARDPNKTIITCYKNISAEDIPVKLRSLQALDMSDMLFSSDLLDRIQRKLPKKKELDNEALMNAFKSYQASTQTAAPSSGTKEIVLNGGVYTGEAIAGKPHGQGTYHGSNGDRYEGNWNVGKIHGQGTYYYSNGDRWTGEWNNGVAWNGSGKFYFMRNNNRVCKDGTLKNGNLYGEGRILSDGRISREGFFENDRLNGQGVAYTKPGVCKGEFRNGTPWNATGAYLLDAKRMIVFDGVWENGQPNGTGKAIFTQTDGRVEGTFHNGLNGEVRWYFADGRRYEGGMKNGLLTGEGKMMTQDGRLIYQGSYANDKPNGKGILYKNNNERYEGEFKDGKFHGQGTYYYPQGSWTGEWKEDRRWKGKGMIFFIDGNGQHTGKFFNGYMVNGKAAGKGILRLEDGSRFDGEFYEDNYYNGTVYNSKNQIIDTYVNGQSQRQKTDMINQAIGDAVKGFLKRL